MTDQRYPSRRPGQPGRPGQPRARQEPSRSGWQTLDAFDAGPDAESDLPPWAVPSGIAPVRAPRRPPRGSPPGPEVRRDPPSGPGQGRRLNQVGWPGGTGPAADADDIDERPHPVRRPVRLRLPGRSRAAAARRRRSRRRLLTWGGVAIAIVVVIALVIMVNQPAPVRSQFVTKLQKGELAAVPNACHVVSAAVLRQYLPGTLKQIQPFNDPQQSQCSYTVDARPIFRVLNAYMQAYKPAGYIAAGNGSATANAIYTFAQQRTELQRPAKNTPQPPAIITPITGLGQQAFSAVQQFHVGIVTDWVTVVIRYRNVLIKASFEAQASNGFGPVSIADLRAGALAVARNLLTAVRAQPTVS